MNEAPTDLFASATPEPDLFSGVALAEETQVAPETPNKYLQQQTAKFAAIATTDMNQPDPVKTILSNVDLLNEQIAKNGDTAIRNQMALEQQANELKTYTGLMNDKALAVMDPQASMGAAIAVQNSLAQSLERRAQYALEQKTIQRVRDLAMSGNTIQARAITSVMESGNADQVIEDINTKRLILQREIDKISGEADGDWIGHAANFLLNWIPTYKSTGEIGNVEVDKGLETWYDSIFNGKRIQIEGNTLYNMPVEEFVDFVPNVLIPTMRKRATILGFQDKDKMLGTLTKLDRPKSIVSQSIENTLDNFAWIGPAQFKKAMSLPGILVRNGARNEAGDILAKAVVEINTKGAEATVKTTTMAAEEVADHILPNAINPILARGEKVTAEELGEEVTGVASTVSLAGEVNTKIGAAERMREGLQALNQGTRLTGPELEVAYAKLEKNIQEQYGETLVKDVSRKDVKLADGSTINQVEYTLGGFSSQPQAQKYAISIGAGKDVLIEGFTSNADRVIRIKKGLPTKKQKDFDRWFKPAHESVKEVGKNTPLHFFNGSLKNFDKFDPSMSNHNGALFFSTNKAGLPGDFSRGVDGVIDPKAKGFIHEVHLKVENPFDPSRDLNHKANYEAFLRKNPKLVTDSKLAGKKKGISFDQQLELALNGAWPVMEKKEVQSWIKSQGHDGFWADSIAGGRNLAIWDTEKIVNANAPDDFVGKIIADESGQYSFKMTKNMSETGFYTETLKPGATGFLSRMVLNARLVGDTLLGDAAQRAGNTRSKAFKLLNDEIAGTFRSLSQRERENVQQVLAAGENSSQWFTRNEREALWERAFGRQPTEKENLAYEAAKELNDVDHLLRSDELYKNGVIRGEETVSFESGAVRIDRENAKISDSFNINSGDRVYDASNNVHWNKTNKIDAEAIARYKGDGYILVNLKKEVTVADGTKVRSILMKKGDVKIEPLRRDQLGYRAGGHRDYTGKYFLKQARIGMQPDGEKYMANPGVFAVGSTKAQIDFVSSRLEAARQLHIRPEGATIAELDAVLPSHIPGKDFLDNIANGHFNIEHEFKTMYDREVLPEYMNTSGFSDLRDIEESSIDGFLRTNGRMYYGHKGEALKDWQGLTAPTLDPFKMLNQSLMNVANLTSFSDYKIAASERWANTFKGYVKEGDQSMSPMEMLRKATLREDAPEAIKQGAEAQRDVIKRTLGWRSEFDRQTEVYTRRMTEWIGGTDPHSFRNKFTDGVTNWFDTNNPIQALRGAAFDMKLGLWNPAQLPLQIGTLIAATTLSPELGFKGMVNLMPLRTYLTKSGSEAMLDTLVSRGVHTTQGMAADEYKAMMRQAKGSGFFEIGGTHQLVGDYGMGSSGGLFSSDGTLRQSGRFFFNEGEIWNRSVAWRIAWGETRERFPELAINSSDFSAKLAGRAEDYAFGMSEQSSAAWQKGITSIPTQFWAYNVRMMEAMLGNTFTNEQKIRLVLGQALMYGSAGIPLAPFLSEQLKKKQGGAPSLDTVAGFMDRGILDEVIYHMTGADILVSKRFGTGAFTTDTIKDIFGMSAYGEKSVADMLGGATGSITMAGFETITELLKYSAAESGGDTGNPLAKDAFMRLASNISTVSNLHKAYLVNQYGTLVSNKGTTLASDIPTGDAWAVALGLSPGVMDDVSAQIGYLNNKKELIKEATTTIRNYRVRMINEPDRRVEIEQEINLYVKLLPENIRMQAIRQAQGQLEPSLTVGIQKQIEKDKLQAEALAQQNNTGE